MLTLPGAHCTVGCGPSGVTKRLRGHFEQVPLQRPVWKIESLPTGRFHQNLGTLALDDGISASVQYKLRRLREIFAAYVTTAVTLGAADDIVRGYRDLDIVRIQPGDEAEQKCGFLEELGPSRTVPSGIGANDARMLRRARLGIDLLHGDGAAVEALLESDVLVRSSEEAMDL